MSMRDSSELGRFYFLGKFSSAIDTSLLYIFINWQWGLHIIDEKFFSYYLLYVFTIANAAR